MTSFCATSAYPAEKWQGPPSFTWAFLAVWALCGVFVLFKLPQNGWRFPRRR
ncbi:hypothetical protein ACF08O_19035 [Streptomyces paradoxus]|uniref:hypothetical protein n=1 Tax=Streptomyces paradoxus TaxID=66375 RepID=UPI0036F797C8